MMKIPKVKAKAVINNISAKLSVGRKKKRSSRKQLKSKANDIYKLEAQSIMTNPTTGVNTYTPTVTAMKNAGMSQQAINKQLKRQNRRTKQMVKSGFKTELTKAARTASVAKSIADSTKASNYQVQQSLNSSDNLINGGATQTIPPAEDKSGVTEDEGGNYDGIIW